MRDERSDQPDVRVAALAAEENGVLSARELGACGLSPHPISRRARNGRLHPLFRGVYAVGHRAVAFEGLCLAAVKAVGGRAVVSHRAAAVLWDLIDERKVRAPELTLLGDRRSRQADITIHRTEDIHGREIDRRKNVPVTSVLRTIIDCAAVLSERELRGVIRRAFGSRLVTAIELARAVATTAHRRGIGRLRRLLAEGMATRSELEDVVLTLIFDAGFEPPDVNVPLVIGGRTVVPDFRWASAHLVIEADGAAWHDNPIARAEDLERQRLLETNGDKVIRVTWPQAIRTPGATRERIRAAGAPVRDQPEASSRDAR